jgi:hypothetical protein
MLRTQCLYGEKLINHRLEKDIYDVEMTIYI